MSARFEPGDLVTWEVTRLTNFSTPPAGRAISADFEVTHHHGHVLNDDGGVGVAVRSCAGGVKSVLRRESLARLKPGRS